MIVAEYQVRFLFFERFVSWELCYRERERAEKFVAR